MKKRIVSVLVIWFLLFAFFSIGLARRNNALQSSVTSSASVLHHRLVRVMSLPFSRAERHLETSTLRRTLLLSAWGATLWTAAGGVLVLLWIRIGSRQNRNEIGESEPADLEESKISRRALIRGGLATLPVLGCGFSIQTILVEPGRLRVVEYTVPIRDLPPSLEGTRITHLSDFHLGDYIGLNHVQRAIAMANEMQPHIALLTGDYVQGTMQAFEPMGRTIANELKTVHGYAGTLGNHDHWHGSQIGREAFAKYSVPLIDNARRFYSASGFSAEPAPDSICIGGVGDFWEDEVDFIRALEGVPESMPRIILSHNPDVAEMFAGLTPEKRARAAGPSRVDLMLSGHTHGGQVRLPFLGTPVTPSRYGQKYAGGLVQGPDWPVIVSRGIGMALLPVRFNVPPEVVLITLTRAV